MKKTLIALLALAGVAVAGTNEEVITLQPAQTACTWQPEFSLEYLHSVTEHNDEIATQGVRANFSVIRNTNSAFSHQFSLSASYEYGDEHVGVDEFQGEMDETKTTLTLGYDLNYAITDKFKVFVGAKAGYATTDVELKVPAYNLKLTADMEGFTASVGGGVKYQITESINVKAGYEFGRYFMGHYEEENIIFNQHIISVGVGYKF